MANPPTTTPNTLPSNLGVPAMPGNNAGTSGTAKFIGGATSDYEDLPFSRYISPQAPKGHRYIGRRGHVFDVKRRYRTGDDWAILAGKDPNQLIDLQKRLIQIGALKPRGFTPGQADALTRNALHEILARSNARGMKYGDFLDEALAEAQASGFDPYSSSSKVLPPALVISHDNPADVQAKLLSSSTDLIGGLHDDPAAFAAKYASQETAAQTAEYNATYLGGPDPNTGAGGQVTKPPSVEGAIIQAHPEEYAAHQLGQHAQEFINMLSQTPGGGSNWS